MAENKYIENINRFEFKVDPENNMLLGMDGCHYNHEANAFYYGQLGLCGCGSPEDVHSLLIQCAKAFNRNDDDELRPDEKIKEIIKRDLDSTAEFIMHFLDKQRILEHGGSVYGGWLSERGKQFIEAGVLQDSLF